MTVYIEYAFLENFLLDGTLLVLALMSARAKICWWRVCLASSCGALFAIFYPFLRLPSGLDTLLKLSVGIGVCLLAYGRLRRKKDRGRYALTCALFFAFSFSFGGALVACSGGNTMQKTPVLAVFTAFAVGSGIALWLVKKLYKRRKLYAYIYACEVSAFGKSIRAQGFLDSGNTAEKKGLPVCFLAPNLFYELYGDALFTQEEQEKIRVVTMSGERSFPLCKGRLTIRLEKGNRIEKEVYFTSGGNMIAREYEILLNARVIEG